MVVHLLLVFQLNWSGNAPVAGKSCKLEGGGKKSQQRCVHLRCVVLGWDHVSACQGFSPAAATAVPRVLLHIPAPDRLLGAGNVPSPTATARTRQFLLGFFPGNFGAADEQCGLAVGVISCQKQIVSHCQSVCPLKSNRRGSAEGGFQLCGCCVCSTSHRPSSPQGRTNSFLISARRWWEMGGPVGWSPVLDYPPSSRVTAASSATKSFFSKFFAPLSAGSVQGSGHSFSQESCTAATTRIFLVSQVQAARRSCHTGMSLEP